MFEFLSLVATEVVPFVFRLDTSLNGDEGEESTTVTTQYRQQQKRLGFVRLYALEFLDIVQTKLGARMR